MKIFKGLLIISALFLTFASPVTASKQEKEIEKKESKEDKDKEKKEQKGNLKKEEAKQKITEKKVEKILKHLDKVEKDIDKITNEMEKYFTKSSIGEETKQPITEQPTTDPIKTETTNVTETKRNLNSDVPTTNAQITEKQLGGVVSEEELEDEVDKFEAELEKDAENEDRKVNSFYGKLNAQNNKLHAVTNRISALSKQGASKEQLAGLETRVKELKTKIDEATKKLDAYQSKIVEKVDNEMNESEKAPEKTNVEANKIWTIQFNKSVDENSVKDLNIIVLDEDKNLVGVKVNYDSKNASVTVAPETEYVSGKTYTLFIGKDIKGKNGKGLKKAIKMEFTIK